MLTQSGVNTLLGQVGTGVGGQIRDAHCNAIFLEVRRNADACYPSHPGSYPGEPYFTSGSFNALQAIIDAAHDTTGGKQRIEVHAWLVTFRTGGGTVYGLHDDTPTGNLTNLDNYWQTRDDSGNEISSDYPFDPGHPKAEDYLASLCMDLVSNFNVDGIHFDYIRFTGNNQGYNPTSVNRYIARYGGSTPPYNNANWQQWRRDQISALVRQVYARVQASKPQVLVSGSFYCGDPPPSADSHDGFTVTQAYKDLYSDWDSWVQEGIVDMAVPMTYYNWSASNGNNYTSWMNFQKDRKGNRSMIVGPGLYLNSLTDSIHELQMTRDASENNHYADGFSGFSHREPYAGGSWTGFQSSFISGLTSGGNVSIPTRTWKTSPTKGHISGRVTYASNGAWADGAYVTLSGPDSRTQYCDGTGFYAFIDLTPGAYTVTVSKSGYSNVVSHITVAIGSVTGNMYVNNCQLAVPQPPPIITNVASSNITTNAASITWNTDQAATTQVQYGTTTSYGYTTTLDSNNVTSHTVNLGSLTMMTTYHYRVLSTNGNGSATSGDYTFKTAGPLLISNVQVAGVTGTTATITWTTNQAASSKVDYGLTSSYDSTTGVDSTSVTSHSMTLTGLSPTTPYHYHVVSTNTNGTATSTDYTFSTNGTPIISNVQCGGISGASATITWNTDIPTDSQVEYGLTTSYGSSTTLDSNLVTAHSVTVSGLTPNTPYNYRVKSNASGSGAVSGNYTFPTDGPPTISNIQVANITPTTATITWTTDKSSDSTVNYGFTSSYGSQANVATLVTSHSVTLTALTPSSNYHFQCVSIGAFGTATSTDYTFATPVVPTQTDIDNTDPGWANTSPNGNLWTVVTDSAFPKIGTNCLCYAGDGSTTEGANTRKCTWTPYITQAGLYDVYAYFQTGPDRNMRAPFTVHYYGGQTSMNKIQYSGTKSGAWYLIAQNVPFNVGTGGYLELTTLSTDTKLVSADAARWIYKAQLDLTPPGITISAPSVGLTTGGPVSYTITYDGADSVTLAPTDITVNKTGTADAVVTVSGTGTLVRTVTLSSISGTGTLGISIAAATASDNAGNQAAPAGPSAVFNVDNTAPTISIGAPSVASTKNGPVDYVVTYGGADAVNLTTANVTLVKTGSADGTVAVTGSGTATRTVTISSITGDGTLAISIGAGTASDAAGNTAASADSATFVVDNSPPSISIGEPSETWTNNGPVSYLVAYGGADNITLSALDITLNTTGTATGTVDVSGTGNATRTVTISSITGSGSIGISIAAGTATDALGNTASAIGPSGTFNVDGTPPSMLSVTDEKYTTSTDTLVGSWTASDSGSAIKRYEYAVGTTPLGSDVKDWTSAGTNQSATISGLTLTVGSTYYISARAVNEADMTSAPMSSAGVQIAQSVATIQAAKAIPDTKAVALPARVVSAVFPTAFYLEEANQVSGIRVEAITLPSLNQSVVVMGTIGVSADGERTILNAIVPNPPASGTAVKPWALITKAAGGKAQGLIQGQTGGTGLNNTGLLVKVFGKVTAVVSDGFYLDDGAKLTDDTSNTGIKVWTGTSGSATQDTYVTVTGIVSLRKSGTTTYPQILKRDMTP